MLSGNKKISIRQAMLIFVTMTFTPAIRVIPRYATLHAQQAGWLSAIFGAIPLFLLALIFNTLYKNYKDYSLLDVYSNIMGKIAGKVLAFVHLIWAILLTALYVRYFAARIAGTIMPNINMSVFMISILLLLAYGMRYGPVLLARANEIILPITVILFFILILLMIPNIRWEFLTPISYRDILPIMYGSIGMMGFTAFFSFIFIFSDIINNKEKIKKFGFQASTFLLAATTILIGATIGTFGHTIVCRTQFPFILAVKQISLFGVLEKLEPIVVGIWVTTDFILMGFFVLAALRIFKYLFKPSEEKILLNIFLLFIYFLSLYLADSIFEMEELSSYFIIPGNIILGLILPTIAIIVGKTRKKV